MSPWVEEPQLERGEILEWQRWANREQNRFRQAGGKLFLTNRRFVFSPHRYDKAFGGERWTCDLSNIAAVGVEPRRLVVPYPTFFARYRRRLRIELRDGSIELFVVNRVKDTVEVLEVARRRIVAPDSERGVISGGHSDRCSTDPEVPSVDRRVSKAELALDRHFPLGQDASSRGSAALDDVNAPPQLGPVAGTVKWWNRYKGYGVVLTPDTAPKGIWVSFTHLEGETFETFRELVQGETVEIEYEPAHQDSFRFRALRVRRS